MKITFSFLTTRDLSTLSQGEEFLDILLSFGLIIEKVDEFEPIRKTFDISMLPERWKGTGLPGKSLSCYFLFKGQEKMKFSGMVTWSINLPTNTHVFNGVHLSLNITRNFEVNELINIGDRIFRWSDSDYGYITEDSKEMVLSTLKSSKVYKGGLYYGIDGLMWVNYFGPAYLKEPDFHIPSNHVSFGRGVRVCLSQKPNDDILSDPDFQQKCQNEFGKDWFRKSDINEPCRIPSFDHSALVRA